MNDRTATDSVRQWLTSAAEWAGEGLTWESIQAGIADGTYHLLVDEKAAALIHPYLQDDGTVVVHILLAGGALEGIERLVERAEVIARVNKAKKVTVSGREGWKKLAHRIGYRVDSVIYSKDV